MFPLDVISEIVENELVFSSSNQEDQLCSFVTTFEDDVVKVPFSITLQLQGVADRVLIQPSTANITIEDDDSMLSNSYVLCLASLSCT